MRSLFFALCIALLLAPCTTLQSQDLVSNRQRDIVFKSVNVIPMDQGRVFEKQTVVVKDGKITALGDGGKVKFGKDALVVDAKGKYLTPGWAEIHAHVLAVERLHPEGIEETGEAIIFRQDEQDLASNYSHLKSCSSCKSCRKKMFSIINYS